MDQRNDYWFASLDAVVAVVVVEAMQMCVAAELLVHCEKVIHVEMMQMLTQEQVMMEIVFLKAYCWEAG